MGIEINIAWPEYQDPIVPNGATWHRACAWAYFEAYGVYYGQSSGYGNGQCSVPVQLVK